MGDLPGWAGKEVSRKPGLGEESWGQQLPAAEGWLPMDPSRHSRGHVGGPQATQKHKLVVWGHAQLGWHPRTWRVDYGSTAASAPLPSQGPRPPPLPGLCSKTLGLYDLSQGEGNGLGTDKGEGVCLLSRGCLGEGRRASLPALPASPSTSHSLFRQRPKWLPPLGAL